MQSKVIVRSLDFKGLWEESGRAQGPIICDSFVELSFCSSKGIYEETIQKLRARIPIIRMGVEFIRSQAIGEALRCEREPPLDAEGDPSGDRDPESFLRAEPARLRMEVRGKASGRMAEVRTLDAQT